MDELGNIARTGQDDLDSVAGSLAGVILLQSLAQPGGFHSNNGVLIRIEVRTAPKRLDRDVVLLDPGRLAGEVALANVRQELAQAGRTLENLGGEHRVDFASLPLSLRTFCLAMHKAAISRNRVPNSRRVRELN